MTVSGNDPAYLDRAQGLTSLTLTAVPTAIDRARKLVRFALSGWGLAALVEDAELVTSELMTNAVRAIGVTSAEAASGGFGTVATVQVRVLMYEASILIEVWDRDPRATGEQETAGVAEGGFSLMVVAALCKRWDFFGAADDGKVAWAELAVPTNLLTAADLPLRERSAPATAMNQAGSLCDPALLRRVHQALKDF